MLDRNSEVLFYRLVVQCDDFGRFDARPAIIRGRCYPLELDSVSDKQVQDWLSQLVKASLVILYSVGGRPYLQMATWEKHQQKRAQYSKYPDMIASDSNGLQVIANVLENRESRNENTISEKRETRNEDAPTPAKPAASVRDPLLDNEAVFWYREICRLTPNKVQRGDIAGRVKDIDYWQRILREWMGAGWKPGNVTGMLNRYEGKPNGHGKPKEHANMTDAERLAHYAPEGYNIEH